MKPFCRSYPTVAALLGAALVLLVGKGQLGDAEEQTQPLASPSVVANSSATQPDLVTVAKGQETASSPRPPIQLSDKLQEVVKLVQSGVGEEVVLAYIQNAPTPFSPTPDQIVYLTDIGISDVIITALVNHLNQGQQTAGSAAPDSTPAPAQNLPPPATYNPEPPLVYAPEYYGNPSAAYGPAPAMEAPASPPPEIDPFYTDLAPYGSWTDLPDYGWCWQPTLVTFQPGWRPYCDRGHWLSTDCGWYWYSDYSWGWAPFHYGRWFHHPRRGWCWRPDSVWGPAWVAWRYSDSHCGWAPLPPGSFYRPGVGLSYYGAHVGVSFGFGLGHDAWTFVPAHRFHDTQVGRHRIPRSDEINVFNHTTVVNNYAFRNHTVVNEGFSRDRLPPSVRSELRNVSVRDVPAGSASTVRPDRLHQVGSEVVIYRPTLRGERTSAGVNARTPAAQDGRPVVSGNSTRIDIQKGSSTGPVPNVAPAQASRAELIAEARPDPARTAEQLRRTEPLPAGRPSPSVPQRLPEARQEAPKVTIIGRSAVPMPASPAPGISGTPSPAGNPSWTQLRGPVPSRSEAAQPVPGAPQFGPQPNGMPRMDPIRPQVPAAVSRFNNAPPIVDAPMPENRYAPSPAIRYSNPAPYVPAPAYSGPQPNRPAPAFSAPAVPRFEIAQPRSAAPVMNAPAPRPTPQPAGQPAPANRRQN